MKKRIVWLIVSCLMALSLVLVSCGPAATEEEEVVKEEEVPTYEEPLSIGETARTSKIEVTILDAIVTESYQYDSNTKEASSGMSFLLASVEIKNVSSQIQREGGFKMRTLDSEGSTYSVKSYFGKDRLTTDYNLPAGDGMKGKVVFEIPKGATGLKIRYLAVAFFPPVTLADWEIK